MSRLYHFCGLGVRSNLTIAGLLPMSGAASVDVDIFFTGESPWPADDFGLEACYVSPGRDAADIPLLRVWQAPHQGELHMRYADGTAFTLAPAGDRICVTWRPPLTVRDAVTYLLGPVLGFVLRLRKKVCLHAGAFAVSGGAVAVAGAAGWGKSTTIATFARRGLTVLADDLLPLELSAEGYLAVPTYPCLRLWPDSVETLYGSQEALPRLTPNWEKRALDLARHGHAFATAAAPLKAVYLLAGERSSGSDSAGRPKVVPALGHTALIDLVRHSYVSYLLDKQMRVEELECFAHLVKEVPIRYLELPEPMPHPDVVCDALLTDLADLGLHEGDRSRVTMAGVVGR